MSPLTQGLNYRSACDYAEGSSITLTHIENIQYTVKLRDRSSKIKIRYISKTEKRENTPRCSVPQTYQQSGTWTNNRKIF